MSADAIRPPTSVVITPEPRAGNAAAAQGTQALTPLAPLKAFEVPAEGSAPLASAPSALHPFRLASRGPVAPSPTGSNARPGENSFWGADGFSFSDLLDIVNPLQHIPLVSTIYQALTGDTMAPGPRMAGGALFAGPIGVVSAVVESAAIQQTGQGLAANATAAFAEPAKKPVSFADAGNNPAMMAALHSSNGHRYRYAEALQHYAKTQNVLQAAAPSTNIAS